MSNTGSHTDVITMSKADLAEMLAAAVAAGIGKAGLASNKTEKSPSPAGTRKALPKDMVLAFIMKEHPAWLNEHFPIGSDGKRKQSWSMGITEETAAKHRTGTATINGVKLQKCCQSGGHEVEPFLGATSAFKLEFPDLVKNFILKPELHGSYLAATTTTTTTTASNSAAASNSSSSSDSSSTGSSKSSAGIEEGQKKKDIAYLKQKGVETTELAALERATPAVVKARKQELQAQWHKEELKATADKLEAQKAATQARHDAAECHKIRTWHHQRGLAYEDMDLEALRESQATHKAPGKPFKLVKKGEEAPPMAAPATAPASNSSASNSSASATIDMSAELRALAKQVVGTVYEIEEIDDVQYWVEQGEGEGAGRAYEKDEDGSRGAYVGRLEVDADGVLSIDASVEEEV